MFYVYEWYDVDSGIIFYVGKGTKNRYKQHSKRNELFTDYYHNHNCSSRIIKEFEKEEDAFKYEHERIIELKKIGQCFCNLDNGGTGGVNFIWTDEMRQYKSTHNPMKDEKQRQRMSDNNPMKNIDIAKKVGEKHRRAVIINEKRYDSVKDVMEKYNVSYDTVKRWCNRGITRDYEPCRFEDEEQIVFSDKRYNKGGCKPLVYLEKEYESPLDLADEINMSVSAIYQWLKRGFDTKGNSCRYIGDSRELTFENRHTKRNKNRSKPIIVNGIKYSSCSVASSILNVPKSTLYSYLQGKKHNPNYICSYDNQQPS